MPNEVFWSGELPQHKNRIPQRTPPRQPFQTPVVFQPEPQVNWPWQDPNDPVKTQRNTIVNVYPDPQGFLAILSNIPTWVWIGGAALALFVYSTMDDKKKGKNKSQGIL